MKMELVEDVGMDELDELSRSLGNTPLVKGNALASVMRNDEEIIGFAAVQLALHTSGSWVHPNHRHRGYTYKLRSLLESGMKDKGVSLYFSLPKNDFERILFAKYGSVVEQVAQVKEI